MAEIEELKAWLRDARSLLGLKPFNTKRSEMKERGEKVAELLNSLKAVRPEPEGYAECLAEYEKIANAAKEATEKKGSGKKDKLTKEEKAKQEQDVLAASKRLAELGTKLDKLKEQADKQQEEEKQELERLKALSLKRAEYQKREQDINRKFELLRVTPYADPKEIKQLESILLDARLNASSQTIPNYNYALIILKPCDNLILEAMQKAEKARLEHLEQIKSKPEAQDKLSRARAHLERLERMPGIDDIVKRFRDLLTAAENSAKLEKWSQVIVELDKIPNPKFKIPGEDKCREQSNEQIKVLENLPDWRTATALLEQLRKVTADDAFSAHWKNYVGLAKRLLAPKGQKAQEDLTKLVADLRVEVNRILPLAAKLENTHTEVKGIYDQLKEKLPPGDMALFDVQFQEFQNLRTSKFLEQATELGAELIRDFTTELAEWNGDYDRWQQEKSAAPKLAQRLTALDKSTCADVPTRARVLLNLVQPNTITALEKERAWSRLLDYLDRARDGVVDLETLNLEYAQFDSQRKVSDQKVQKRAEELEKALSVLVKNVGEAAQKKGSGPSDPARGFQSAIDQIKKNWKSTVDSTPNPDPQGALDALTELEARIAEAQKPDGVQKIMDQDGQDKARTVFQKDWAEFEKEALALQAYYNKAWLELTTAGKKLRDEAAADYVAAIPKLQELRRQAASMLRTAVSAQQKDAAELKQTALEVETELKNAEKAVKEPSKFAPIFTAFRTEIAELLQLGASTSMDAIAEARTGLKDLLARAKKLAAGDSGDGPSLDEVLDRLEQVKQAWAKIEKTVTDNCPKTSEGLKKQLTELESEVVGIEPALALPKLESFNRAAWNAKLDADVVIGIRDEFDKTIPSTQDSLKRFTERKSAPTYAKSLKARLAAATKLAEDPDKLFQANEELKTITEEINTAVLDNGAGLKKEGELLKKEQTDALAKAEYERAFKLLTGKQFAAAKSAVASVKGDAGLVKELDRMAKLCEQTAKEGNYTEAINQVRLAAERAQQIVKDPFGPTIGSRNDLPKDVKIYRTAVSEFRKLLKAFPASTAKVVQGMDGKVYARLEKTTKKLIAKFNLDAFSESVAVLSGKDTSDADRRAARESGIAAVHEARDFLEQNPQMRALAKNPIATAEFSLGYRKIEQSLTRLEANMARSCK